MTLVEADSAIKDVLGLFSKYQFQYRRPCRWNFEAALDGWHSRPRDQIPKNLTANAFHVLPNDFKDSLFLCPGFLMRLDKSAIGDDAVCSMLCNSDDQWWSRHVVGVSFPFYLWTFHGVDALSIEKSWLELPLIRQGKPTRGIHARQREKKDVGHWRQPKGKGHWRQPKGKGGKGAWSGSSKGSGYGGRWR